MADERQLTPSDAAVLKRATVASSRLVASGDDGVSRVMTLLREPPVGLMRAAEAHGAGFGPRRNKARPPGEQWEVFAIGSLEVVGAYATRDEAEEVAFQRSLAAKSRATLTAIADYLDQHARTAPEAGSHSFTQHADTGGRGRFCHWCEKYERDIAPNAVCRFPRAAPEVSEPSRAELIEALTVIGEFGGKTLIMATDDPHERSAYSLGAHRAFEQTANIARVVLSRARRATT